MTFDSFLNVNGVPTHVACWGRWVEEDEPDEVVVLMPGNPGLVGFYYPYLERLHALTGLPVWTIGHAGHEEPPAANSVVHIGPIKGREDKFNLNGQLVHKLNFLKQYTKPTTKIHLVGHSIGAWICLELMKDEEIKGRIASNNLLFPTLQKMAVTPNGFFVTNVLRRITTLICILLWIFNHLPYFIQSILFSIFFMYQRTPALDIFSKTIRKYLCQSVVDKVLFMALDEMKKVVELDRDTIVNNMNKIKIVYGDHDGWAPAKLFIDMKRNIPDVYVRNVPYQHAFCLTSYDEMAALTANLITQND